ncbi:MAG TPA: hypothetical protein VKU44_01375 [Terriglobia bacterium]|nr:hypothetical protein [Terriglobia bacterium]
MRNRIVVLTMIAVFFLSSVAQADFKYTETTQMSGGMMAGLAKFAGAFSKNSQQAMAPTQTTIYVKGNRYRRDETGGKVHIIDLDGRRMIDLDTNQHTYTVITFEQMKQAAQQAAAQARQQPAQPPQAGAAPAPNVTITPKVEVTPTGATRTILYRPAQEVKMRAEMQMQTDDPRAQGQSATFVLSADSWIAPVTGYDEVRQFNQRMVKELDWVPGALAAPMSGGGGAARGGQGNIKINPAMMELNKQTANLQGLPLLQYTSIGMGGMPAGAAGNPGQQPPQGMQQPDQGQQQQKPSISPVDMVPQVAIGKALGGALWKRHKQQQQDQAAQNGSANTPPPPSAAPPGTFQPGDLMDMTTEVNSFSSDSLPGELFDIPAGYTQAQAPPDPALAGR